jgi:hypothetical protein
VLVKAFPLAGTAGAYPLSIEPIYAGLAVSLATYAAGWAVRSRPTLASAAPAKPTKDKEAHS